MARTITVKGIGKVTASPDYVVLSMALESKDVNYDKAMEKAAWQIQHLNETLEAVGFEKKALKTTNFNVRTEYSNRKDVAGNYKKKFEGYAIHHSLKLEFDFDMSRLSQALSAIAGCVAHPELSIAFTVRDATAVKEEMLRSAAKNAQRKAEVLCEASGVKLGNLLTIDYNWGELDIYSHTRYQVEEDCAAVPLRASRSIDMEPDDIEVSDTATFVWEIQ